MSARTVRDYSRISYDTILEDLLRIARSPDLIGIEDEATGVRASELQDWLKSSTGRMLAEWLAHVGEVDVYHVVRAFRNSFVSTADTRFGSIASARGMGYSIRRPVPASCRYMPIISGQVGAVEGYFTIGQGYNFTIGGNNFITKGSTTWYWRADGIVNYLRGNNTDPPDIYQGEIKRVSFFATGSVKFQKFFIDDATFSDLYGESDPFNDEFMANYNSIRLEPNKDRRITKLIVNGESWMINRKSLATSTEGSAKVVNGVLSGSTNKTATIKTIPSGGVEIKFGDGTVSQIPYGLVEVEYLSTNGTSGITTGIVNEPIQGSGTINFVGDSASYDNVSFIASIDATGGADMESMDSVAENAIASVASSGVLGNKNSHISFLNSLPGVRQGVTFGEEDVSPGSFYMFNIIGYSLIKDLYILKDGSYTIAEPSQYALYGAEVEHITERYYSMSVNAPNSNLYFTVNGGSELQEIQSKISSLGHMMAKYAYVPPKVHKFTLSGTIIIKPAIRAGNVMAMVKNDIYKYLQEKTRFAQPIYDSALTSIVAAIPGVVGCMLNVSPREKEVDIYSAQHPISYTNGLALLAETYKSLYSINEAISRNLQYGKGETTSQINRNATFYNNLIKGILGNNLKKTITTYDKNTKTRSHNGITEKMVDYAIYKMYDATVALAIGQGSLSPSTQHDLSTNIRTMDMYNAFINWAVSFRHDTNYYTAYNLTSGENGDSNIDDYSMKNETAQIEIKDINFNFITQ